MDELVCDMYPRPLTDPQTFAIIGAAMEVHRQLGCGFPEGPYCEALEREFTERNIPFESQAKLEIVYKGFTLKSYYRADFICYESVIVELKSLKTLSSLEESQVISYLKAGGFNRALLLNFGRTSLQLRRFLNGSISSP
jgi:GxxExxY protein